MSKRWAKGSSRSWRRVRALVLARDGYRCQLRLDLCTTLATAVHHTVAREVAGDSPAMLIACCQPCNNTIGDPTRHDPAPRPGQWW